jgi:hypothetical protein
MNPRLTRPVAQKSLRDIGRVVCLVCLLGVTLSAAVLPHVAADELGWVVAHLE